MQVNISLVPERRRGPELMDLPPETYSQAELSGSLADIRAVNRYLGDTKTTLRLLEALTGAAPRPAGATLRVLDVATGSADIPVAIARWAEGRGVKAAVTAVDVNPLAVREAERLTAGYPEISLAVADGFRLPFADGSFDIVTCVKALHHFTEEETVRILREMDRVSSVGIIAMDLRRSSVAWALIWLLTRLFTRNRLTRFDGPMSVLRSYTVSELDTLGEGAGVPGLRVFRAPLWRIALVGHKGNT